MQVFLNETSLEGQFVNPSTFDQAIEEIIRIFGFLNSLIFFDKIIYIDSFLINFEAIKGSNFLKTLNSMKNTYFKEAFIRILFDRLHAVNWRDDKFHNSEDSYIFDSRSVTDTSIAELAERKIQNRNIDGFLVNFLNSSMASFSSIEINKNSTVNVFVDLVNNFDTLKIWLESKLQLSTYLYDFSSTKPPSDKQTALRNSNRYVVMKRFHDGRRIYQDVYNDNYVYVDNFHYGVAAHLEIFDREGIHLGEANLQGEIKTNTQDNTKFLTI